jgi:hypothetical protein
MNLRILPSAVRDLHRGREFYARQSDSLGDYFLDSLFSDIDSLELYAGVHAKFFGYCRLLAKRFPFAIYYKIDGDACSGPCCKVVRGATRNGLIAGEFGVLSFQMK